MPYEAAPHDFLKLLRGWKSGTYNESPISPTDEGYLNKKKYSRLSGEAFVLQLIAGTYIGELGYDDTLAPNLAVQFEGMAAKINTHGAEVISSDPRVRKTAVHIAPYLRNNKQHRDVSVYRDNREKLGEEEAAVLAVTKMLERSVTDSLQDDIARVHTFSQVLLRDSKVLLSDEKAGAIMKRSTQPNMWFSHSHGKYDDDFKLLLGRVDENGHDTLIDNIDFYRSIRNEDALDEEDKIVEIQVDAPVLESYRRFLNLVDPAETDQINCPAAYSQLIHMMWIGSVDIFEKTHSFFR